MHLNVHNSRNSYQRRLQPILSACNRFGELLPSIARSMTVFIDLSCLPIAFRADRCCCNSEHKNGKCCVVFLRSAPGCCIAQNGIGAAHTHTHQHRTLSPGLGSKFSEHDAKVINRYLLRTISYRTVRWLCARERNHKQHVSCWLSSAACLAHAQNTRKLAVLAFVCQRLSRPRRAGTLSVTLL